MRGVLKGVCLKRKLNNYYAEKPGVHVVVVSRLLHCNRYMNSEHYI